jgi:hypothetical protein
VVEGKVDMDANYALEDYEIARLRLSCQLPGHRQAVARLRPGQLTASPHDAALL